MKKTIFRGSGVAIVTPMNEDGSVSYNALGELIEFQIQNGTDAIIVCGTTGESATLSEQEHEKVVSYTVQRAKGRIPVIAGTGSNNTEHALTLSKKAEELGVDGLLIVTPYYNKTSQSGILKHYNYIADRVNTPIIVYNVPSRTGCNISPDTYLELSRHPNIVAAKEAGGNISAVAKIISLCGENLKVYSGNDDQIVPVMSLGGIGVISVLANICPKESHEIVTEYLKGNASLSAELQLRFLGLIEALFSDVNPVPVKEALNLMGFPCGKCRMPLDIISNEARQRLKKEMDIHGLVNN